MGQAAAAAISQDFLRNDYRNPARVRFIWKANQTDPLTWTVSYHMNFYAHLWRAASVRRVGLCLVSCVLPFAASASFSIAPNSGSSRESRPYLTVVTASPLRFEERPAPPPLPSTTGSDGARPRLAATIQPADRVSPTGSSKESSPADGAATPSSGGPAPTALNATPKDKPDSQTPPIIPDDTRPKVRPEDFLPFFQFPGSGANPSDVAVAPTPAEPGKLPPSSATYRQQ
jgi:hypothetical protein